MPVLAGGWAKMDYFIASPLKRPFSGYSSVVLKYYTPIANFCQVLCNDKREKPKKLLFYNIKKTSGKMPEVCLRKRGF